MAFLQFNKSELVNLSYSLKREILLANKTGAYCNTSIVTCNTRRYHGLLAVPVDRFDGGQYMLLSSLDESLVIGGKQFNLGIHCYGGVYDPRGHKYIIDFEDDGVPTITYKVGEVVFRKSLLLDPDHDQTMVRFELVSAPGHVRLLLKPFLAFRNVHTLTRRNPEIQTGFREIPGGVAFRLYDGFPDLHLQTGAASEFVSRPYWYDGVTYTDEYRRGFDCREDLFVPGQFEREMAPGEAFVFSASVAEEDPRALGRRFAALRRRLGHVSDPYTALLRNADLLKCTRGGTVRINAGFSWLYTGLLRETLAAVSGLTLYADGNKAEFEAILDGLIAAEQERLFRRTTQVEAPLSLPLALQEYIDFGADPARVWKKYGATVRGVIESYGPGRRKEVGLQPNGLLWAQAEGVALSWMNAYIHGRPVTERPGYQVETNAYWYNALCFALDMESRFGADKAFVRDWTAVRDLARTHFTETFWNPQYRILADYVDGSGQHLEIRPNQMLAVAVPYCPVSDDIVGDVLRSVGRELVTRRGIRTLSPRDVLYKGVYEGTQDDRDLAYHQGSTRPWLLGPYLDLNFRLRGASFTGKAEWLVKGFFEDLNKHGVGAFSELYDGDPPHEPHGAISSALSTAALLRARYLIEKYGEDAK